VGAYLAFTLIGSFLMAVVFQLAHAVQEAMFLSPEDMRETKHVRAVHEVESTVDFCQKNRALTWLIGGLNYQIEHHLFPRLPHTIYPDIAPIVRRNAEKHGVRYTAHPTLRAALRLHYHHCEGWAALDFLSSWRWAECGWYAPRSSPAGKLSNWSVGPPLGCAAPLD